jgi:very-short-patch-repair endonuclease
MGFSHFHGSFSNPSPFKGEVRRGMGYICRCSIKQLSRNLRRSMTDAEKLLWSKIRGKQLNGLQFYRQKIIGNYIVDFYCPKIRLVVEIDGGQHYSAEGIAKDSLRDEYLTRAGIRVLR